MSLHFDVLQRLAIVQLWQLTAIIVIAAILTYGFCRRRPHLAYVLWLIVLVKAVTPPVWSSPTGLFSWADAAVVGAARTSSPTVASTTPPRVVESVSPAVIDVPEPDSPSAKDVSSAPVGNDPGGNAAARDAIEPTPEPTPSASTTTPGVLGLGEILGAIWLCGAAALAGLLIGRWSYYFVLLHHHRVDTDERVHRLVDDLSRRLGIRRRVDVLVTTRPFGPAVGGVWRPTLILPQALVGEKGDILLFREGEEHCHAGEGKSRMSPFSPHLERIVAHELIHVRRGDPAVGVLQLLAQIVWWFHPLVWWTNRRVCVEREQCCDEQVVASLGCDPGTYAQSLLDTLKLRRQLRPALLPGVDAPEVTKQRLENIMDRRKVFRRRMPGTCWVMLVVGVLFVVPGAGYTWSENAAATAASEGGNAAELAQQGWQFWAKGQLGAAEAKFKQAVKLAPDDPNIWNGLGWASFNSGKQIQAEDAFRRAVKLRPDHPAALNGLGQLYLMQRKFDLAEKFLLKAAPQAPAAWFGLARLYLLQGKFEQAEKWAQKIIDSGNVEETELGNVRRMFDAAKKKQLDDDLRRLIEPPTAKHPAKEDVALPASAEPTQEIALVDGAADLQKMIDDAKPGDVVVVPEGTYDKPITIGKSITLKGENVERCILDVTADEPAVMITSKKPATIESLTIRWQRATSDRPASPSCTLAAKDAKATVRDCRVIASGNAARCPAAVSCDGFSDVYLVDCRFEGFEFCINYAGGAEGKITDCVVLRPGHCGITVYDGSKIEISKTIVAGSRFHGIRSTGGRILAHDNLIVENKNRGIYLGNRPASGVIRGNVILGNATGISVFPGTDVMIANNVLAQSDYAGIDSRDACPITVKGNVFLDNSKGFILFPEAGRNRVKLQKNTFWGNKANTEKIEPGRGSLVKDPKFKDPDHGDFTPQADAVVNAKQGLADPEALASLWKKWKAISTDE
ncbi:MAG TPA: M56 family metallopeptidase [Thermoguttaceae bacterium]|nr:M56 family metallopeptidase [Thermoguttaceae bacterium]